MEEPCHSLTSILEALHALTLSMLEQAKQGEVDALEGLEVQRQKLVALYQNVQTQHPEQRSADLADKLQQIVDADAELLSLCQQTRDQVSQQLQGMSAGKKVTQAYQDNSG